ncbi:hypothetical protein FGIG_09670 [Fasciola gigantica]|uniref:Uncharacterized protein n=1 Tax=Fasciola gigantica TaxID=46835 RepID=A0A504YK10_FASGI|nr:hypothetical protein FGIG_09670 [Fasciola gigantica]
MLSAPASVGSSTMQNTAHRWTSTAMALAAAAAVAVAASASSSCPRSASSQTNVIESFGFQSLRRNHNMPQAECGSLTTNSHVSVKQHVLRNGTSVPIQSVRGQTDTTYRSG